MQFRGEPLRLAGADLSWSVLYHGLVGSPIPVGGADFRGASLDHAILSVDAVQADFSGASLRHCQMLLMWVGFGHFAGSSFVRSDLSDATLFLNTDCPLRLKEVASSKSGLDGYVSPRGLHWRSHQACECRTQRQRYLSRSGPSNPRP